MSYTIQEFTLQNPQFPESLSRAEPAIQQLFVASHQWPELLQRPRVAIVGSRKITPYGQQVTQQFTQQLVQQGIVIVSGLAIGVDACAHRAALAANGQTIAVMPADLTDIYPRSHHHLAQQIIERGGALISEYAQPTPPRKWNFIERNRIVAGIAAVILVTEATRKSGTMHTARFALEQGKDVFAIPGPITHDTSTGTNQLIKTGAGLASGVDDILLALGITPKEQKRAIRVADPNQQILVDLFATGEQDGVIVFEKSKLPITVFNQALTMLEITGVLTALGNNKWALRYTM